MWTAHLLKFKDSTFVENRNHDFLGDYNNGWQYKAFVDLNYYPTVRQKFNRQMSRYDWQLKPTLIGYASRYPKQVPRTYDDKPVPFIYVTNMEISYRDYLRQLSLD